MILFCTMLFRTAVQTNQVSNWYILDQIMMMRMVRIVMMMSVMIVMRLTKLTHVIFFRIAVQACQV